MTIAIPITDRRYGIEMLVTSDGILEIPINDMPDEMKTVFDWDRLSDIAQLAEAEDLANNFGLYVRDEGDRGALNYIDHIGIEKAQSIADQFDYVVEVFGTAAHRIADCRLKEYIAKWIEREEFRKIPKHRRSKRKSFDYSKAFVKLVRRDGPTCAICGIASNDLQIDHIHPVSKGGSNDLDNLQLLCPKCNLRKSDKVEME